MKRRDRIGTNSGLSSGAVEVIFQASGLPNLGRGRPKSQRRPGRIGGIYIHVFASDITIFDVPVVEEEGYDWRMHN